ncbi:hypothetical protein NUW58_g7775 [Xylaria curta]|uniref:Uncharacterized protein n=1 Tax=Xylaria curta TaxID=42375 RepID=A0ACC1NF57_9PEZI|nr:hypothetical protein NUW58_g7775 [Xylaria curta]
MGQTAAEKLFFSPGEPNPECKRSLGASEVSCDACNAEIKHGPYWQPGAATTKAMDKWNSEIAPSLYQSLEGEYPLRLLIIHPAAPNETLKTELIPTTLDQAQGCYDATSYTWGAPENPELISCGDSQLWVQRNAFHMMLDLRRPDKPRKVWIDAVCINQCNPDERASQVAMMHHIYRRAGATWVWLGRPDEHTSAAMAYAGALDAKKFVKEFLDCQFGSNWYRFAKKSYFFDGFFNAGLNASELEHLTVSVVSFLNRPWFSRVWIQQEASLCQKVRVVCGSDIVDWDNIFALAWIMCPRYTEQWPDCVQQMLNRTINNIQAVRIIQRVRHYYFQDVYGPTETVLGFEGLVESVSRYEATDPRDRIYAMGNIIAHSDQWFEVDYRVPWQILYTDVARRFLDAGALRFLKNAGRVRQEADTAIPSWVPDYSYREESRYMISSSTLWRAGGNSQYAIPGKTLASASKVGQLPKGRKRQFPMSKELRDFRGPKKSLLQSFATFKCLMSDEVTYVGDYIDHDTGDLSTNITRIVESIRKDIDYIGTLEAPTYINGDTLLDAYKLTLIMSCDAQQEIVSSDYIRAHWEEWFKWYKQGCPRYWDADFKAPAMNLAFESSAATRTFRFAATRHGYFCLVPRMVQIGDLIAIFQSYELAVVLRRLPSTPTHQDTQGQKPSRATPDSYFELLGDAYVHGMMENEARCIIDEFDCRHEPTQAQLNKMLKASGGGQGEPWATLSLCGQYERIFETLGPRAVRLV